MTKQAEMAVLGPEPTNGGKTQIEYSMPYIATATIVGTADLLFHRWNCESVEAKAQAAKRQPREKDR
jgi:hypothetical protein